MSAPAWFNSATYVANKLAQLQATEPEAGWTGESLQAAFTANGYSNDADGMYRHFVDWGNAENVSPSPYFVVSEYMANKLAQLQRDAPAAGWDMTKVEQAFRDAGLSAWDHYTLYGQAEGISPSSLFDNNAYLAAKLTQLQRDEAEAGWASVAQVVEAFQANGLNPIEHYLLYGINEALAYTPLAPVAPERPVTDELTTARDVLNPGAGDHIIGGVASTQSAEKTLNENDLIDGGAGNDTLRVIMNSNFHGFTVTGDPDTTGGMQNVENVELIHNSPLARYFFAKGIEGVTSYTLKAGEAGSRVVNLKDISTAGITVNVEGLKSGAASVDFAAGALDGAEDSLTLGLINVGAAPTADGGSPTAVKVSTAAGLESVTINASGPNYINLSGVDAPRLGMTGSGSLTITGVHAALESFDGSAARGNVTADLSAAAEIKSLVGTRGDDIFIVKNLNMVAALDGGAGDDILWLDGVDDTLQPTCCGFETIGVKNNTQLTLSGKNAQDVSAVSLEKATVTLANLNASAFTVNSLGMADGSDTANAATLGDAVQLTVNVEAAGDDAQNMTTHITAANAADAVINVGANVREDGTFRFGKAQSVRLNVTGNAVDGVNQTSFDANLDAVNATLLAVTAGADVTLDANSRLGKVESLNIIQSSNAFDASAVALGALNSLTITGSGKDSAATFGNLGDARNAYRLNVVADGLAASLKIGHIATQDDVTLDFANVTGEVNVGAISAATVNVHGSEAGSNTFTTAATSGITTNTLTFIGGLAADTVGLCGVTGGTAITATLDTGASDDTVTIAGVASTESITVSGDMGGDAGDTITIDANKGNAAGVKIDICTFGGYANSVITGVDGQSDTIIGGSGNDTIIAGSVAHATAGTPGVCDTLAGGDGADSFILSGANSRNTEDGPTTIITDFDAAEGDTLKFADKFPTGSRANYKEDPTDFASLDTLLEAADYNLQKNCRYFAAMVGNDTYIVSTLVANTHNAIVKLQGVNLDQLDDDGCFILGDMP
ncbi:calcium-binding protein [uncultured Desulfovibrio sp.]|uniref:calcium-binding protein n=1 Tax=uncultured Desulfovibrio sp. TaxID=167968 RepID=UPI00262E4589|nr:calcium-binding protein [uncultured Desulfovibrio sp.]